jgi:hypothetical protein
MPTVAQQQQQQPQPQQQQQLLQLLQLLHRSVATLVAVLLRPCSIRVELGRGDGGRASAARKVVLNLASNQASLIAGSALRPVSVQPCQA